MMGSTFPIPWTGRSRGRVMTAVIDIAGKRFGRWTVLVIHPERYRNRHALWLCRCEECGTEHVVRGDTLRGGESTNCGCIPRKKQGEKLGKCRRTHGMSRSRAYRCWESMLQRCFNPRNPWYSFYGGRGITVCERWLIFENFYADVGDPPPGLSLDRIDNNGNYEPSNCRWATSAVQVA